MANFLKGKSCFNQIQMFLFLNSWHLSVKAFLSSKRKKADIAFSIKWLSPGKYTGLIQASMLIVYVMLQTIGMKEPGCGENMAFGLLVVLSCGYAVGILQHGVKMTCTRHLWVSQIKEFITLQISQWFTFKSCNG